jgi:hypothetical protein
MPRIRTSKGWPYSADCNTKAIDVAVAETYLGDRLTRPKGAENCNELGKLRTGFFADLNVVNANPLESIKLLSLHENLDVVMIVSR